MSRQLALPEADAGQLLSFWAGLHDIGKASPDFQGQSPGFKQELEKLGFHFNYGMERVPHGVASSCILPELFQGTLPSGLARKLSLVVGGHHGVFPGSEEVQQGRLRLGNAPWQNTRKRLFESMSKLCRIRDLPRPVGDPGNAFYMLLAGLTSVADWIASNEDFFPYKTGPNVNEHLDYAKRQALDALDKLGWTGWAPPSSPSTVQQLFEFENIRPLQKEAETLAPTLGNDPALVIIEAPMGEGKTEAAIYLADSRVASLGQRGYYFALPTMATSDQMLGRVQDYLKKRYHDNERINLMLLHGHAALSAEFQSLKKQFTEFTTTNINGDKGYDGAGASVVASEWFTHRKRGLLAPFGVGTIDQALLGVLQTRHVFVRLFGLAHKTIIIDEVHAYDAYMTTLLERLLEWLAALGSSVVLLSATLPRGRRDALLRAYAKGVSGCQSEIPEDVAKKEYPRISWIAGGKYQAKTIDTSADSRKELRLKMANGKLPEDGGEFELGKSLKEKLAEGGSAAVICNTVDQAQKVYLALKPYFPGDDVIDGHPVLDLLHARYLYGDRKKREERTLLRFGKPGVKVQCADGEKREVRRPRCAVLVATQIIEQSLDLDFDLMVTEMAPVDLLLQRAGRLHRHKKNARPVKLSMPTLWIFRPEETNGIPDFGGGTQAVYDYHILLRTWLEIKDKDNAVVKIPEHIEDLIEAVYDDSLECPAEVSEEVKGRWSGSRRKHLEDMEHEKDEAETRWIKRPGFSGHLGRIVSEPREEDDPTLHTAHQALTRLTGLTVNVISLYGNDTKAFLDKKQKEPLDFNITPNSEVIRRLLEQSVSVARYGLTEEIIKDDKNTVPRAWRETSLLRHHRILFFDKQGMCQYGSFQLRIDDESGLVIKQNE
jgi:CRISPR-associated endonuclease/helicase Cas3